MSRVTRAVIPAAGLGTRFLPATKAQPKEMLPLLDRPGIQYTVEEAAGAGIRDVVIVTGRGKRAIEDHFDRAPELEAALARRGDEARLRELADMERLPDIYYVRQKEPRGLGDAVRSARGLVEDRPFAVLLADELLPSGPALLTRMMRVHEEMGGSVVALAEVEPGAVDRYGIVRPHLLGGDVCVIEDMVEKPPRHLAPSRLAIIGRYIISPSIFPILDDLDPGAGGEIQLTDALRRLVETEPMHGVIYGGTRFDTGTLPGYLAASVHLARLRPGLWQRVTDILDGTGDR